MWSMCSAPTVKPAPTQERHNGSFRRIPARHVHAETGMRNLCLAGGVALNCVGNGRVLREGPFDRVWIQPAAGDAGGALGVALFIWHQVLDRPRAVRTPDAQQGSLLGPRATDDAIRG